MNKKTAYFLASTLFIAAIWVGLATIVTAQTPVTVEPGTLRTDQGGTVTIYATGTLTFTTQDTVRLVGHGVLPTSYVNVSTLQTTIPTGLTAGDHALFVLNGAGDQVGSGSITLVTPPTPTATPNPTKTPQPYSPPPPGQPNLDIRNYSIDPPQVRPGQEFTIRVEVYNNGSRAGENTMAVIPGGTFVPVGENGHLFWQVHINHTFVVTQRMRVPANMGSGVHNLRIDLSANDYEGTHYDFPQNIAVEVIGGSGGTITGKPKILIEGVATDPPVVAPGTPFTMTLKLANRGNRTAINVMTSADTAIALPGEGGGVASTAIIRIDESITLTLPLLLQHGQEGGRQGIEIAMEYGDYSGNSHSDQQTVVLDIDASLAKRPQLLIDGYHTTPEHISPGDSFTLTLQLTNVGGGDAQRLTLALGGTDGEHLGDFVPIEGSNVSFVPNVGAEESSEIALRLLVSGNADTKAHNLPVALAYDTAGGTRETDTQRVSLIVRRRPDFKISFYRPVEAVMVGQPFQLPIEIINASSARFNIPELAASSEQLEFLEESSTYIGALDSGGSWTLDTTAVAMEPGPVDVIVNAHYVDDLNQTQIISQALTVQVMDVPDTSELDIPIEVPNEQPEGLWAKVLRFVKGFLGLGS